VAGPVRLLPLFEVAPDEAPDEAEPEPPSGGDGGAGSVRWTSGSLVVPEDEVACAEVAVLVPGHQATNQPSATIPRWSGRPYAIARKSKKSDTRRRRSTARTGSGTCWRCSSVTISGPVSSYSRRRVTSRTAPWESALRTHSESRP